MDIGYVLTKTNKISFLRLLCGFAGFNGRLVKTISDGDDDVSNFLITS